MQYAKTGLLSLVLVAGYGYLQDRAAALFCPGFPFLEYRAYVAARGGWEAWINAGFVLALPLTLAANVGHRPRLEAHRVAVALTVLLVVTALLAAAAWAAGFYATTHRMGRVEIIYPIPPGLLKAQRDAFMAGLAAYQAARLALLFGGVLISAWIWRRRAPGRFDDRFDTSDQWLWPTVGAILLPLALKSVGICAQYWFGLSSPVLLNLTGIPTAGAAGAVLLLLSRFRPLQRLALVCVYLPTIVVGLFVYEVGVGMTVFGESK